MRPGSNQVAPAADSNDIVSDGPNVRLVASANKIHLPLNSLREANNYGHGVWYTSSTGGSWAGPVKLPIDRPRSTNSPFALTVDSHGRIAAVYDDNSSSGTTACGYPIISLSPDGAKWTTCGPGKRTGGSFDPQSSTIGALYGPDDRLKVVWHQVGDNKYSASILLWRE